MMSVVCNRCGKQFETPLRSYNQRIKRGTKFYCSTECSNNRGTLTLKCNTCGKIVKKEKSVIEKSKTGNVYCSRRCAAISNNEIFPRGNGIFADYRAIAFSIYEHKCSLCGWNEDIRILEVHHIDENRKNNNSENLCILCPICHRKITLGYYYIDKDKLEPTNRSVSKRVQRICE